MWKLELSSRKEKPCAAAKFLIYILEHIILKIL